jgi:hypothetical protein
MESGLKIRVIFSNLRQQIRAIFALLNGRHFSPQLGSLAGLPCSYENKIA